MAYPNGLHELLAELVYEGLERNGWSQAQLAREAVISEKHVSEMLTGKAGGTVETWDRLLRLVASDE